MTASGALASLLASGAKFTDQVLLISALEDVADGAMSVAAKRIGGPLLFDRIWERLAVEAVLADLLKDRGFEFAVERAAFAAVLHRLFVSGPDRDCAAGTKDCDIPGIEGLELHHFYRAMAWFGEEIEEKADGALAPRCVKDLIEEKPSALCNEVVKTMRKYLWTFVFTNCERSDAFATPFPPGRTK